MATPSWADHILDDASSDLIALDAVAAQLEAVGQALRSVVTDAYAAHDQLTTVSACRPADDVALAKARAYHRAAASRALTAFHDIRDLELATRAVRSTLSKHHERLRDGRPRRATQKVEVTA